MLAFIASTRELGKPYKTMWVTDLDYVKKERDKVLELLKKKAQLRQRSLLGSDMDLLPGSEARWTSQPTALGPLPSQVWRNPAWPAP